MSNQNKSWPRMGYIKKGKTDPYLKLDKKTSLFVDGESVDVTSLSMPRFLTYWDKENKQEVVVGKLVKRENENGETSEFLSLEPNVSFKVDGSMVKNTGIGSLTSQKQQLARIDDLVEQSKITEDQADEMRTNASYSQFTVTLPPPRKG